MKRKVYEFGSFFAYRYSRHFWKINEKVVVFQYLPHEQGDREINVEFTTRCEKLKTAVARLYEALEDHPVVWDCLKGHEDEWMGEKGVVLHVNGYRVHLFACRVSVGDYNGYNAWHLGVGLVKEEGENR